MGSVFARSGVMSRTQIPLVVPQSSSLTMTSWATSTRRRVRYPESAVRSAVSASPLRVPCVEMKYSSTVRPSVKLAWIGRSMIRPVGSAIRPRIPASWRICWMLPRAPEPIIIQLGGVAHLFVGLLPQLDDLAVSLVVGHDAAAVHPLDVGDLLLGAADDLPLRLGVRDVHRGDGDPGLGRVAESDSLDVVDDVGRDLAAVQPV